MMTKQRLIGDLTRHFDELRLHKSLMGVALAQMRDAREYYIGEYTYDVKNLPCPQIFMLDILPVKSLIFFRTTVIYDSGSTEENPMAFFIHKLRNEYFMYQLFYNNDVWGMSPLYGYGKKGAAPMQQKSITDLKALPEFLAQAIQNKFSAALVSLMVLMSKLPKAWFSENDDASSVTN